MPRYHFRLPDIGEGIAEAEIVAWHIAPGDRVEEDQIVADMMTDKATVEISSPVSGLVVAVAGEVGAMAAIGSTLIEFDLDESGIDPAIVRPATDEVPEPVAEPAEVAPDPASAAPVMADSAPAAIPNAAQPLAAPAVRQRAAALGVALTAIAGSGPDARVTHADLDAHLRSDGMPTGPGSAAPMRGHPATTLVKVVGLRRKIAEKMAESKRRIPHFSYVEEVDVTELEELRLHLNRTKAEDRPKLTLLPFLIRGLVRCLADFPHLNATFDDAEGVITRHGAVHLGMATQTPDGLIVPVIRHAEALGLWDLATEIGRLAAATRNGTAARDELSGSTITLTSLGPLGGLGTPVINHPEVAIIGPNRIIERPVVRDGRITVAKLMNISSSFDHRVVDGCDAAQFIQALKGLLEHPATLFME